MDISSFQHSTAQCNAWAWNLWSSRVLWELPQKRTQYKHSEAHTDRATVCSSDLLPLCSCRQLSRLALLLCSCSCVLCEPRWTLHNFASFALVLFCRLFNAICGQWSCLAWYGPLHVLLACLQTQMFILNDLFCRFHSSTTVYLSIV